MAKRRGRKSIADLIDMGTTQSTLKRTLGPWSFMILGIAVTLGAGIYTIMVTAAAVHAGPAVTLSIVLAGSISAISALCYAELSAMIPVAGSAYSFASVTFEEELSWLVGWDLILEFALGAAVAAASWSAVLAPLYRLPSPGGVDLGAIAIILVMAAIAMLGVRESVRLANWLVVVKISVILLFVYVGFSQVAVSNYSPFMPPNTGETGVFGVSGVLHAAGMLYFAFIGFDALATFAEELKNPQRDLPRGILGTLVVTSVLYVLFAAVLTGAISYRQLAPQNGIVDAYQTMFPPWLARTLAIGTLIGLFGTVFAFLFSQSRVLFSLARDGLVPRRLANVHPRYRTPTFGTAIGASLAILAVLLLPLGRLTELLGIGTLFAFTIVCASVLKLRYESPDAHRPFKVWFFPWLPMAGIALNFMLAVSLGLITWARFFGWMLLGVAVYFLFGRHHSRYANDPHA